MTDTAVRQDFGQNIDPDQLGTMARDIASGIGDGRPVSWAGFVWYKPEGLFQQNLLHRVERRSHPKAA